jgi:hypothetical protein
MLGSNDFYSVVDKVDFDVKVKEISTEHPKFDSYFQAH